MDWSSHTALILLVVGVLPSAQEHRDLSKVCAAEQELYFLNLKRNGILHEQVLGVLLL